METVVVGILGWLFLAIFYSSVRLRWPESYVSMSDAADSYLSEHVIRYAAFRLVPVYLAAVFVSVTTQDIGEFVGWAVIIMISLHLGVTNLRALARLATNRRHSSAWVNLIVFHILTCVAVSAVGWVAVATHESWASLIPGPEASVAALWTGLFAAVVAVMIQRITRAERSDEELLRRARADLGDELWQYVGQAAAIRSCDADLMRAIVLAEVLQRPSWVRDLERLKGTFFPKGTYGVAQVGAAAPISDRESIDLLCQRFAGYYPERHSDGYLLYERLAAFIEQHNYDAVFVQRVMILYQLIQPGAQWETTRSGADKRPTIEVLRAIRKGQQWLIEGTASVFEGNVIYTARADSRQVSSGSVQADLGAPGRGSWSLLLPLEVRSVSFQEEVMEEDAIVDPAQLRLQVELE